MRGFYVTVVQVLDLPEELSAETSWISEFAFSSALMLLNYRLTGCGHLWTGLTFSRG